MKRFDLDKIKKSCKFDMLSTYKVLCAIEGVSPREGCITAREKSIAKHVWGDSYILNLSALLLDRSSSLQEKLQYIDLAGKRNFFDYRVRGDKTLNISLINSKTIKNNTLLNVANNKIHFKFEENNSGAKF
jgi:hypothetical protein